MSSIQLTRLAKADLKRILRFSQKRWGRAQRNLYLKQFELCFQQLANNPHIGKTCEHIGTGYRKFPQGSHLIFYKTSDRGQLYILRILHQHMDVPSKFLKK